MYPFPVLNGGAPNRLRPTPAGAAARGCTGRPGGFPAGPSSTRRDGRAAAI
ncbi:hypothetical protein MTY_1947 [Moorella thermoacetica Y72]|uniref:Uncharacterized protein n=1 Tax=Moorella thermoacetica Y72 TaxID=1325331 RepID=A0A0S6UDS5_NEOTH|nr:hypothetical protein MTY_1947 [Moorella thermoacetica Y72]